MRLLEDYERLLPESISDPFGSLEKDDTDSDFLKNLSEAFHKARDPFDSTFAGIRNLFDLGDDSEFVVDKSSPIPGRAQKKIYKAAKKDTGNILPKNWQKFRNGYIPAKALDPVEGGLLLRPDAADAYRAMKRAAKRDGVNIFITDAYRDFAGQVKAAEEKGLYSEGGLAAVPGTSNHGLGVAVDAGGDLVWMAKHGKKFGWVADVPREPWHFEYRGGGDYTPKVNAHRGKHRPPPKVLKTGRPDDDLASAADAIFAGVLPSSALTAASSMFDAFSTSEPSRVRAQAQAGGGNVPAMVPAKLRPIFAEAAKRSGLSPRLLAMVAKHESGFNIRAVSSAGAQGVMQIMPLHGLDDPYDPKKNILFGAKLLASYIKAMGNDIRKGLAAYNAGPGNFQAGLGYADSILKELRGR